MEVKGLRMEDGGRIFDNKYFTISFFDIYFDLQCISLPILGTGYFSISLIVTLR